LSAYCLQGHILFDLIQLPLIIHQLIRRHLEIFGYPQDQFGRRLMRASFKPGKMTMGDSQLSSKLAVTQTRPLP